MSRLRGIVTIHKGHGLASNLHCSGCMKTTRPLPPLTTTCLKAFIFGCAATLAILAIGCGSVTQVTPDVQDGSPSPIRGEVPQPDIRVPEVQSRDAVSASDTVSDGGGQTDSGERADGNGQVDATSVEVKDPLPVCPPHLTCAEGKLNNCLCPVCVERYECNLQGSCRCPDGGR
jgi:hypothetical protein